MKTSVKYVIEADLDGGWKVDLISTLTLEEAKAKLSQAYGGVRIIRVPTTEEREVVG